MRLSQLTRLSRIDLETELDDVQARIIELQSILDSPEKLRGVIKSEMTGHQGRVRHAARVHRSASTPAR